jgi:general secretion pathway protein H
MVMNKPSSAIGSETGYTLVELLVVLCVIGLVLTAVPVIVSTALPGARAKVAAQQFASDLRAARMGAILRGSETKVMIDPSGNEYAIQPDGPVHRLAVGLSITLIRPAARQQGAAYLSFYPDGSSSGGVVRVGSGQDPHLVTDHSLTGRIGIDE